MKIMGWTSDQQKALKSAGYIQSSADPNKMINGGHWAKSSDGGSITVSTSRHNTYGSGMSGGSLSDRLKK